MNIEQLHRSLFEALTARDYDAIKVACASDYTFQGPDGATGDLATALAACAMYNDAFPDLSIQIDAQWSPSPDVSIIEYTGSGTHQGPLGEIPPTNRSATTHGCSIIETRDGKVVNERLYLDSLALFQQLGLV